MFGCDCFYWNQVDELYPCKPYPPFTFPSTIPQWPQGQGFATGRIHLGVLEVLKITKFISILSCNLLRGKSKGVTFYKPVGIPDGFFCLGHYCQSNEQPLRGYVLVARDTTALEPKVGYSYDSELNLPALEKPLSYSLIWSTDLYHNGCGYFWLPNAPVGYKPMGILVTDNPEQPELEEVRCVRGDLTETCETCDVIFPQVSHSKSPFQVWSTRPCKRGMTARGVSIGTFFCSTNLSTEDQLEIACLKNLDSSLHAMPTLDQVHALIKHYGPTVFFHPDEVYLPSSVPWFFKNGALLYEYGKTKGENINYRGSNLPNGGENDGAYWIDLPENKDARNYLKKGNLESAELYVHVKPA
ncbi:DUF946 domain-containing protein [Cephalotus follicularis]|uniref:DUF946 domain-containing protein n=1 Tax=Cephalotus follicularis TaxID=3775 RepID=A0A1Q3CSI7_CEPFO|nr:DUF946 domain-containing protein [Cephalotus follicularis]